MSDVVYANNPSAYIHLLMDQIGGKRDFGDSIRPKKVARMSEVPVEFQSVVRAAVGDVDSFEVSALEHRLNTAEYAIVREDKGVFGHGLFGVIGGGDNQISAKEEARAAKHDPVARELMKYIHFDHARLAAHLGGRV